jgi:mRNA interferase RelE/StbE
MSHKLQLSSRTLKFLRKLDRSTRREILQVLKKIADDPYRSKPLRYELKGLYRARIGKYRIIFEINDNIIFILSIEHRKKIYRP